MEIILVHYWFFKPYRKPFPSLTPFCLPFAPDQRSEESYFIFLVIFIYFVPPSLNLGFTPLPLSLLTHAIKIIYFMTDILYLIFALKL